MDVIFKGNKYLMKPWIELSSKTDEAIQKFIKSIYIRFQMGESQVIGYVSSASL